MSAKKDYSTDEILKIKANMRTYGGSFVKALSEALITADATNRKKLIEAFPELMKKYLNF